VHSWIWLGLPGGKAALRPRTVPALVTGAGSTTARRSSRATSASLLLALVALALVASGCDGAEDPTQVFAREAVESYLADDAEYDTDEVHCTGNPRPWFVERQATAVICAARRTEGGCDWFRVDLVPRGSRVTTRIRLEAANAGCVLP
jgi:hypothetical protein